MTIDTILTNLAVGQTTQSTASSFSATPVTGNKPTASATRTVISFEKSAVKDRTTLRIVPFGVGSNNNTISVKVIGWNLVQEAGIVQPRWSSRFVCEVAAILSSTLAAGINGVSAFECDTLTLTNGIAVIHQGTADVDVAWFECDGSPFEYIEVIPIVGNATNANALVGF